MPLGQGGVGSVLGSTQGEIPVWHGIYYGAVASNADPKKKNRCQLRVPQLLGSAVTTWALPLTPMVDPPAVGTLVSVLFSGGDLDYPVYLVVNPAVPIETASGNVQPVGTTASAGTSHKVAAADHVHTLANALESTDGNIQPVGTQAAGTSAKAARADHVHPGSFQPLGSGGFNEIDSSGTSGGDPMSSIQMFSQAAAGQTTIILNAHAIQVPSGTTEVHDILIDNAPSNSLSFITGGNTVPGSGPGSYSSTWGSEVGSTIALMFNAINQLNSTVDAMYSNLYS